MNRRRVLSAIGGSATMLSLAGCTGSDDSDESSANGDDDSENGTEEPVENADNGDEDSENGEEDAEGDPTEDVETEKLIASAGKSLDEAVTVFDTTINAELLEEQEGSDEDDEVPSVDTDRIETLLDDADDDIEAARSGANDEQRETLDSLATLAEYLRDLGPALSAFNDAMTVAEEGGDEYLENDEYEAAIEEYERAAEHMGTAVANAKAARETFDDLESDAFESVEALDRSDLTAVVDDLEVALESFEVLFTGMRQMVGGLSQLFAGIEAPNAEQYQTAAEEFEAASDRFYRSYATIDEGAMNASGDYREHLREIACEAEAFSDSSTLYAEGAEALADGDYQRADEKFIEGDEVIDRCEGDSESGAATPTAAIR